MTRIYQATISLPITEASISADRFLEEGAISVTVAPDPTHSKQSVLTIMALQRGWFKRAGITTIPTLVRNTEWKYTTHEDRAPIELLPGVWITSSLHPPDRQLSGLTICLDPRDAFGDGYHPTTQLCGQFLAQLSGTSDFTSALDAGTGTGVLAILASKLGIRSVDAMDIDPASVRKTRRNAKQNQCKITVSQGDVLSWQPATHYDIVVANLLTNIIEQSLSRLLDWVRPGGYLILSGISIQWKNDVTDLIQSLRHTAVVTEHDGWCGFLIQKPQIQSVIDTLSTAITNHDIDHAIRVCDTYLTHPSPGKNTPEIDDILDQLHRSRHIFHEDHPYTLFWNQLIQNLAGYLGWIITADTSFPEQCSTASRLLHALCNKPDPYTPENPFVPQSALLFKAYNEAKPESVKQWVKLSNLFFVDPDSNHWVIGYLPADAGGPDDPHRHQRQRCFSILFDAMRQAAPVELDASFNSYIRPIGALLGLFPIDRLYSEVPYPLAEITDRPKTPIKFQQQIQDRFLEKY